MRLVRFHSIEHAQRGPYPTGHGTRVRRASGFTLFELTLVVLIISFAAGIVMVGIGGDLRSGRLSVAANMLASDIEFCQSECINKPSTPRSIVFNTTTNQYSILDSASVVIAHPSDGMPFTNDFATGRNAQLSGVTVVSATMGGATFNTLTFDAYGRPTITAAMAVQLSYNGNTMTVHVAQTTGDVTISSP